ncbi:MAG: hypothetical protein ACM32F_10455, partial [Betaproteobacteria bacterium]
DAEVRAAFEDGLLAVHAAVRRHVESNDAAWALISQSVGAVMLARALPDDAARDKVLSAVKRRARALVRATREHEERE